MAIFEWSSEYAIGEPEIDAQHQEWFRRVQGVFEAIENGGLPEAVEALEFAESYTNSHFRLEELMLRSARFDGLDEHVAQHRGFGEAVKALLLAARSGDAAAPLSAAQMMSKWIVNHIKRSDRSYAEWIALHHGE
ncbi:MAG TPA: bacteriohemerythrin [Myxococcales bacterium]|nr:bacteriohemerythrin [Myxococcales bacterium]